jgi:B9 domain-containing protein 1
MRTKSGAAGVTIATGKAFVVMFLTITRAMEETEDVPALPKSFSKSSTFSIAITGQIEKVSFTSYNHVYCKFTTCFGVDWTVVAGSAEGITQVAKKAVFPASHNDSSDDIVWNHPLDVTFSSCNPFGWPQIVFSVHGMNAFGSDVIRGYGVIHVPPIPGSHSLSVPLFAPEASSLMGRFRAWISDKPPEFVDARVAAQGEGRGVLSVQSEGLLSLKLNVIGRDLHKQGYRYSA